MYILQLNQKIFIKMLSSEILTVSNPEDASQYQTIGEAMQAACKASDILGFNVKAVRYNTVEMRNLLNFAKEKELLDKPFLEVYNQYNE